MGGGREEERVAPAPVEQKQREDTDGDRRERVDAAEVTDGQHRPVEQRRCLFVQLAQELSVPVDPGTADRARSQCGEERKRNEDRRGTRGPQLRCRPGRNRHRLPRTGTPAIALVPLAAGEAAEEHESDQRDDQPDPEAPDEDQDDPDEDDNPAER